MSLSSKPEALTRNLIYMSHWVNLYVDKVQFPNGSIIEKHHLLDFERAAVMIIARDAGRRYLMVKVCRYPTGSTQWEFPAGGMEDGEEIIESGKRELLEETGYHSINHELLYSYAPLNGIANQVFHILRCQVTDNIGSIDVKEISDVKWFSEDEIWQMIHAKEMLDGYTLTSFMIDHHL